MARDELKLDLPALDVLFKDLANVTNQFMSADNISRDLGGAVGGHDSPAASVNALAGKIEDFASSWSIRRGKIADAMEALAKSVHAVNTTFSQLDAGLGQALTNTSARS